MRKAEIDYALLLDEVELKPGILFKGLDPEAFAHYFSEGGILPSNPYLPTLANWWYDAKFFMNTYTEWGCFAIVDTTHLPDEAIRDIDGTYFCGDYIIPWESVALIVSEDTLPQINELYTQVDTPNISWNQFLERVHVLKDPNEGNFRRDLLDILTTNRGGLRS